MTLTRAFRERSRLTAEYASAKYYVQNADYSLDTTEYTPEDIEKRQKDFIDAYEKMCTYEVLIKDLNTAIDTANAASGARRICHEISALKLRCDVLTRISNQQTKFRSTQRVYDAHVRAPDGTPGDYVMREFKAITDMDLAKIIKTLQKEIQDLEDELAELNGIATVELSQNLKEYYEQ